VSPLTTSAAAERTSGAPGDLAAALAPSADPSNNAAHAPASNTLPLGHCRIRHRSLRRIVTTWARW
jgi:hypothetical protein